MFKNSFLRYASRFYQFFISIGSHLQSLFLFYMRVTWGHQFFLSGLKKFQAIENTAQFFASLSIPAPLTNAYFVAATETVCGFLLFIGLGSRIAAIPLGILMLVALSTAHAPDISQLKFLMEPLSLVRQAPYPFLITTTLVFVFGPGKISLDGWIKRWVQRQAKY